MKRLLCAVLVLVTLIGIMPNLVLTPASAAEAEPRYCYEATPAITKAAFQYLDKIYIEKFPELALEYSFGSGKDKKTLKAQATKIVSGIETDEAKANAIVDWVTAKIEYVSYMSGEAEYFAIDTYYEKKGNCLGISQLIVQLCRLSGIKAVMCCGTRGNMKEYVTLENREMDHAWVMIHYNDAWHLFDPLFSVYGETSKSYIAKWYFIDFIEGVSPYVKKYADYINYGDAIFYIDGRFMHYKNGIPASDYWGMGAEGGTAVNWALPYYTLNRYDNKHGTGYDGYEYVENPSRKDSMINDECFSNGWVTYGADMCYTRANGIRAGSTFKTEDGVCYYLPFMSSAVIMPGKSTDYTFTDGFPTVMKGSTLKLMPTWVESELAGGKVIVWESQTPDTATVSQDGKITALADGYACLLVSSKDAADGDVHYMACFIEFYIASEERTVKYSSNISASGCDIKLSKTSYSYDGKVKTPTVTVKNAAGRTLKEGTDYTVTYASGRKNPGTYKVTVEMKGVYTGTKTLSFKISGKASVTTQPKTQKVEAGETVKFAVKATGYGLKYQWQSSTNGKTWKNCVSSSAKKATFTFTGKTSHSSNYYRCRITDGDGNVVYTDTVRLYVLGITEQPVRKTVTKGKTAKFEVEATGASKVYQWQVSTDGGKTWKNCSSSSAKKATFTFTGKDRHDGNYYRCRIKDSGGNTVYSSKVKLTVK